MVVFLQSIDGIFPHFSFLICRKEKMKKSVIIALISLICISCSKSNLSKPISNFTWLTGKWKKVSLNKKKETYEKWSYDNQNDHLIGKGFTLVNNDTVFSEDLKIFQEDKKMYYSAELNKNKKPVLFRIKKTEENLFVSENLEHDFPKRIAYQLRNDTLIAVISDDNKSIPFRFIRLTN
jgi:hypothetical protein